MLVAHCASITKKIGLGKRYAALRITAASRSIAIAFSRRKAGVAAVDENNRPQPGGDPVAFSLAVPSLLERRRLA